VIKERYGTGLKPEGDAGPREKITEEDMKMYKKRSRIKNVLLFLLVGAMIIVCAETSQAATYWVSPAGTASWSSCLGATPLSDTSACSATTAMANAVADDVVNFRAGTYNVGMDPGDGYNAALQPNHSGTSGHPITFQAYPGETPIINSTCNSGQEVSRTLGNGDTIASWITFDGFTVEANNGLCSGSIHLGGTGSGTVGFTVKNSTIIGGSNLIGNDNRDGIRIDETDTVVVQNNKVYGFYNSAGSCSGDNDSDWAAIKVYRSNNVTIENNELYNSCAGISFKRYSSDIIIRYNYIHGVLVGLHVNVTTGYTSDYNRFSIFHNVITTKITGGSGIHFDSQSALQYINDVIIYNNTVQQTNGYGCLGAGHAIRLIFYNNICATVNDGDSGFLTTIYNNSIAEEDYNQWGTFSFRIQTDRYDSNTATYTNLTSWKTSGKLISGVNPGTGDLASDPLFLNASGLLNQLTDFKLSALSPSKGTGKGGVDMGADISKVGTGAPSPPTNLKVQ
jgi:hypothetical protein